MSQSDLAAAAGTYQSVIGRIENGTTSPGLDTLARLVAAAGFELNLSLEPAQHPDPVIESFKPGIDQALLAESLQRSVDARLRVAAGLGGDRAGSKRAPKP